MKSRLEYTCVVVAVLPFIMSCRNTLFLRSFFDLLTFLLSKLHHNYLSFSCLQNSFLVDLWFAHAHTILSLIRSSFRYSCILFPFHFFLSLFLSFWCTISLSYSYPFPPIFLLFFFLFFFSYYSYYINFLSFIDFLSLINLILYLIHIHFFLSIFFLLFNFLTVSFLFLFISLVLTCFV